MQKMAPLCKGSWHGEAVTEELPLPRQPFPSEPRTSSYLQVNPSGSPDGDPPPASECGHSFGLLPQAAKGPPKADSSFPHRTGSMGAPREPFFCNPGRVPKTYQDSDEENGCEPTTREPTKRERRTAPFQHYDTCEWSSSRSFFRTTVGSVPFRTHSSVTITLIISRSEGISYIIPVIRDSTTARSPRAPI